MFSLLQNGKLFYYSFKQYFTTMEHINLYSKSLAFNCKMRIPNHKIIKSSILDHLKVGVYLFLHSRNVLSIWL